MSDPNYTPALTTSRNGRELTVTGRFTVAEVNGEQRWALRIVGVQWEPSIALNILRCKPTFDNVIGIAVFDFIEENTASLVQAQLREIHKPAAFQTGGAVSKPAIDWDTLTDAVNGLRPPIDLEQAYKEGAEKYHSARSRVLGTFPAPTTPAAKAQALHRQKAKCGECGNSGFYEGFNTVREPCSQGCKPR